jgi:hypothetical protein
VKWHPARTILHRVLEKKIVAENQAACLISMKRKASWTPTA